MADNKLREIPLKQIRPGQVSLRSVKKETEEYLGLVDSIKERGVLNSILVREAKDPETNEKYYSLIDGLHRYTASLDAGRETIPAHVMTADESDVLELQIIGNIHKIETKAVQYSEQLHRLLALQPTLTIAELAKKLGKSVQWLNDRLQLTKLSEKIQELANESSINITNACQLAKLPEEEQTHFVDRAMTMPPNQFVPAVAARLKELRDAARAGRQAEGPKTFAPVPFLQKLSDIKAESTQAAIGRGLINQVGVSDPVDVWKLALNWVLHLDPVSVEAQKAKDDERKRNAEEAKAKKKAERDAKKAQEAAMAAVGSEDEDEE